MVKRQWHLTDTGEPKPCEASVSPCPKGGERQHFPSAEAARQAYEERHAARLFSTVTRRRLGALRRAARLGGGLLVTSFALSACSNTGAVIQDPAGGDASSSSASPTARSTSTASAQQQSLEQKARESAASAKAKLEAEKQKLQQRQGNSGRNATAAGVLFQGKPLQPTAPELKQARQELAQLVVAPDQTVTGFNRKALFGQDFQSGVVGQLEHRDVTIDPAFQSSSPRSRAVGGSFIDPYTGEKVSVSLRSKTDSDEDHIVPLARIMGKGAQKWTGDDGKAKRLRYANDPEVLVTVSSSANRQKGDKGVSQWLPSYEPAQCRYAMVTIHVSEKYGLSITPAEQSKLQSILDTRCVTAG